VSNSEAAAAVVVSNSEAVAQETALEAVNCGYIYTMLKQKGEA
jgi:hypothetical protein